MSGIWRIGRNKPFHQPSRLQIFKDCSFMLKKIESELKQLSNEKSREMAMRYFKTGQGQYGEGDIFLGIRMPDIRRVAGKYSDIPFEDTLQLLKSPYHEKRMLALIFLVNKYKKGKEQNQIYSAYMKNKKFINNWDLVDVSAPNIVGAHLFDKDRSGLYRLAGSRSLWDRRIAIISTFYFIQKNDFEDTLKISQLLLMDGEDLIHKASGWMLREVGKRNPEKEEDFLEKYSGSMPRTMLRYAIEKFPEKKRKKFLNKS